MGLIELVGQDFGHRDRRPFADPLHRRDLHREKKERGICIRNNPPARNARKREKKNRPLIP
jgi:hypothetical protein